MKYLLVAMLLVVSCNRNQNPEPGPGPGPEPQPEPEPNSYSIKGETLSADGKMKDGFEGELQTTEAEVRTVIKVLDSIGEGK